MLTEQKHRPAARISANGQDITSLLLRPGRDQAILTSLTITDEAGIKSDRLELVIDGRQRSDGKGWAVPAIGSEIEVWLGYEPAPKPMGRFRFDSWTKSGGGSGKLITLSASRAELDTAIKEKRLRSYHQQTLGQIADQIAKRHSLKPRIDPALASAFIEHVDQQGESDLAFLTRLAARYGATFKVGDGKLVLAVQASPSTTSGQDKGQIVVRPADVSDWSVTQAERGGHKSAVAYWHDHRAGKRIAAVAGHGKPRHLERHVYSTKAEAQAAANASLARLTRGRRCGQIDGPGNPAIYAEAPIRLEGFDPDVDSLFFAKTVTHSFSSSGYTTSVSLESEKGGEAD